MIDAAATMQEDAQRELPDGWRWVRLGDVCELLNGFAFDSINFSRNDGTPLIRIRDLKTNIPSEYYNGSFDSRYLINPDSLLIGMDGEFRCYRWQGPPSLLNQRVCQLLPNQKLLNANFLYYSINDYLREIESQTPFTTVKHISSKQIVNIQFALPPLTEQKRIAAILIEQMVAVEQARSAAEAQLGATRELPAAYLRAVFESDEAQGWQEGTLSEFCEIQLGKMLSPLSKSNIRPRPYLRNQNVQWNRFDLSHIEEMDFTEAEERKFELKKGDLLVCEGGEPGRAAVWNGEITPCYYQKALHRLRPIGDNVDSTFIMYRFWNGAIRGEFLESHAQTTIAHLPAIRLSQLLVKVPELREQQRIVTVLTEQMAAVEQMRQRLENQLATINQLPAALLRRAFSGEL